jgi:8-oxo-dGTP pyrophosphatase MutT (NUDIX family)
MKKNAAIAIIFNTEKNAIVLTKRRDVPVWVLPGGGIDEGETPELAAVREASEETGLIVKIVRQVAEYSPVNRLTSQTYTYECGVVDGEISVGAETKEIQWFSLNNLPSSFFYVHHEWLEDALKDEPNVIRKKINSVTYWKVFTYFFRHPTHVLRMLLSRMGFPLNS